MATFQPCTLKDAGVQEMEHEEKEKKMETYYYVVTDCRSQLFYEYYLVVCGQNRVKMSVVMCVVRYSSVCLLGVCVLSECCVPFW